MRWRVLGVLVALGMLAVPGCGGSLPPVKAMQQAKPAAPRSACVQPAVKGKPSLCLLEDGTTYIVGLPAGHAWKPGNWVLLSVERPGLTDKWPAAVAVVKKAWDEVATVSILYQREAKIHGAQAWLLGKDERAPLDKFVGRVREVQSGQARIDVGSADGVVGGDVYELRAGLESDQAIGQIRVTEVGDQWAWGGVLGQTAPVTSGTTVVFKSAPAPAPAGGPVKIMVVDFHPDSRDALEGQAAQTFAQEFARDLDKEARQMGGVEAWYEENARVAVIRSNDPVHAEARAVGKQHGADVVVWGTMKRDKRALAQLRFTVVEPMAFGLRGMQAADVRMDRKDEGFELAAEDSQALAAAILGTVAFEMQRYGHAASYLHTAVSRRAFAGDDELEGYWLLTYSEYVRGHVVAARIHATELVELAHKRTKARAEMLGRGELARLDALEGKADAARKRLREIRVWAEAQNDSDALSFALHALAMLEVQQGHVEEARTLFRKSLEMDRGNRDVRNEALTLHALAVLEAQQDQVDDARKLYKEALDKHRDIRNIQGEAATLHGLANLEVQQGRVQEARKLYQESLEKAHQVGDEQGEAATLHDLATLEAQQDQVDDARKLYKESLDKHRDIRNIQGEAATLHGLANLEAQQGRVQEARKLYQESLEKRRRIADVPGEANTLNALGVLEAGQGRVQEARKLYQESLEKSRRIEDQEGAIATQINLAVLDLDIGKRKEGRATLEDALQKAQALRHAEYQARCHDSLGALDKLEGNLAGARTHWQQALKLYKDLGMQKQMQELTDQLASLPP